MKKRVQWLFNYKGPFCISEKNKDVNEKSLENIYIYIFIYISPQILPKIKIKWQVRGENETNGKYLSERNDWI